MLKSPYPNHITSSNLSGIKVQCDMDPQDKTLIQSLLPAKGTIQRVTENLIHNLCNDIRQLGITGWRIDGDEILSILVERRKITGEQSVRLGLTTIGISATVSAGILHTTGGSDFHSETEGTPPKSTDVTGKVDSGKRRKPKKTKERTRTDEEQTTASGRPTPGTDLENQQQETWNIP